MTTRTVGPITHSGFSKSLPSRDRKAERNVERNGATESMPSSATVEDGGEELSKDIIWEQMFEELKAIKEKTGTCSLPDKKGRLAKWVYAQRKAFRRLQFSRGTATTRARLAKLESIGFEFSSSSYVSWDIMFEKYKNRDKVGISDDEARKLKLWMSNQRLEYSRLKRGLSNNITQDRIAKLEAAGFQWVGRTGKPTSTTAAGDGNESVSTNEDDTAELNKSPKKRRRTDKGWRSSSSNSYKATTTTTTTSTNVNRNSGREILLERDHRMKEAGSTLAAIKRVTMEAARAEFSDLPGSANENEKDDERKVGWAHRRKESGSSLAAVKGVTLGAARADCSNVVPESVDADSICAAKKVVWKKRKGLNEEYEDSDAAVEKYESDSSCSRCDQVGSKKNQKPPPPTSLETRCNRENKNLRQQVIRDGAHTSVPSLGVGESSRIGLHQSTAGLGMNLSLLAHINPGANTESDFKISSAVIAAGLDRNAASASIDMNSSRENSTQREIDWSTAASSNSAILGSAYFSSLSGQGMPSAYQSALLPPRDSLPHGLTDFSTGFMQLPIPTISSTADSGGLFIPSYLSSAAAALVQQQLLQQSMAGLSLPASFTSNDVLSSLPMLGGGGSGNHLGLPPYVYNALVGRYPTLATLALGGTAEDQTLGESYHPLMARFLPQR